MLLVLRDTRERFSTYSASDIKALIASKMKAVKREPVALQELYRLERMISEVRLSFEDAKNGVLPSSRTSVVLLAQDNTLPSLGAV